MQRLILQSVNLSDRNGGTDAEVILQCEGKQFVGRVSSPPAADDMAAVSQATLEALTLFLKPITAEFKMTNAAKMQPEGLTERLLVVTVECLYKGESFSLTGSCLSSDAEAIVNAAKATLDATNRITDHILESEGLA